MYQCRLLVLFGIVAVLCAVLGLWGCDGSGILWPGSVASRTVLTSTSLSGSDKSAQQAPAPATVGENGLEVTPDNVTGKALSLLFATDDQDDEGIVVFGNGRPDIAPADSELYDFDFADSLAITATATLKPGFVGGQSSQMVLLFGYLDMHLTVNGQERVVRIAMVDTGEMQRGDKLLLDEASGTYQWYDADTEAFTDERPDSPAAIAAIRDFEDPIRPNQVFYAINAMLLEPIELDADAILASSGMTVTLDFVMTDSIVLVDQTDETSITDETLITSLDLSQNVSGYGESGFAVDATFELTP